jgi:hypothetical protein
MLTNTVVLKLLKECNVEGRYYVKTKFRKRSILTNFIKRILGIKRYFKKENNTGKIDFSSP